MKNVPVVSLVAAGLVGVVLGVVGTYTLGFSTTFEEPAPLVDSPKYTCSSVDEQTSTFVPSVCTDQFGSTIARLVGSGSSLSLVWEGNDQGVPVPRPWKADPDTSGWSCEIESLFGNEAGGLDATVSCMTSPRGRLTEQRRFNAKFGEPAMRDLSGCIETVTSESGDMPIVTKSTQECRQYYSQ